MAARPLLAALTALLAGCSGQAALRGILRAAREDVNARRWAAADARIAEALRLGPQSPAAHELLAFRFAAERGKPQAVEEMGRRARAVRGPGSAYGQAVALFQAGDARALARLRDLVASHPRYGAALRLLALLEHREGRRAEARELLERSILVDPAYLPSYRALLELTHATGEAAPLRTFTRRAPAASLDRLRAFAAGLVKGWIEEARVLGRRKRHRAILRSMESAANLLHAVGARCAASVALGRAARALLALNDRARALRLLLRGVAWCREEKAWAVAAVRLRDVGAFRKMTGDFDGALRAFAESEEAWRRAGDLRQAIRAIVDQGSEATNLSRWDEAERAFRRALAGARSLGDREIEAEVLITWGNSCGHRGLFECAVPKLREALRLREVGGDTQQIASALVDLGKTLNQSGETGEAIRLMERALSLDKGADELGRAATYVNLGAAYRARGDHVRALSLYRRAARALGSRPGFERFLAVAVSNLGNVYRSLGLHEKALEHHERALALKRRYANQREVAETLEDIAMDLRRLGRREEALARARESLQIHERSGNRRGAADGKASLAVLLATMDRFDEARALLEDALRAQRALGLRSSLASTLTQLALLEVVRGGAARARAPLEEAAALSRKLGREQDWLVPYLLGIVHGREGNPAGALAAFQESARLVDEKRRSLVARDFQMGFLANVVFVYHHLARTLLAERGDADLAFDALERAKARTLLDRIESAGGAAGVEGVDAALVRKERRLARLATRLQKRLAGARPDARAGLEARRRKALDELDHTRAEIQAANPLLGAAGAKPVGLERLRRDLLPEDTVLLEYSVGEEETVLLAVSRERMSHHVLKLSRKELADRVQRYRERYLLQREVRRPRAFLREGAALYRDLVGPLDPALLAKKTLLIIPDGPLGYLPFEALFVESDPRRKTGTFLVERHAVSYAPSASVLAALTDRMKRRPPAQEGFAALGDPVYDYAAFLARRDESPAAARALTRSGLARLPATAEEVRRIGALFAGKATLLVRDEAREERVKAGALRGHRFVHVASHGILDENFQALALTLDPRSREDGFLELREIYGLHLDAEMVVLSACQTGEGRLVSGEGVVGLTHAFLLAGAPRVVVSLWKVADESTAALMVELYKRVGPPGAPRVAQALREAKLALLRARGPFAAPYFWAPFIAVGVARGR